MKPRPTVSVAICTRGRPTELLRALDSVRRQADAADEVIVVDNESVSDLRHLLLASGFGDVAYHCEPREGLDFARNRALAAATSEIVAFLDDDAVADADWLRALRSRFVDDSQLAACTGRVGALETRTPGARIFESNGGFSGGGQALTFPGDARTARLRGRRAPLIAWVVSSGCGCNLAVRREAALAIGGFDPALDLGEALPGGGDHDIIWRLLGAGHHTGYEPSSSVAHEHRATAEGAYDQIVGHQRALVALLVKCASRGSWRGRLSVVPFLGWRLVKPLVRLARRWVGRDPLPASVLLRILWNCWRGLVAYPAGMRLARRRAASAPAIVEDARGAGDRRRVREIRSVRGGAAAERTPDGSPGRAPTVNR